MGILIFLECYTISLIFKRLDKQGKDYLFLLDSTTSGHKC